MASWRMNNAFAPLNAQLRIRYPRIVIYGIGDPAHQKKKSDHNPNSAGRVNAEDFMLRNGFDHSDAVWLTSWLIQDSRTKYVIFNRRIWEADTKEWNTYRGDNPHTDHVHLSVFDSADNNDRPWRLEKEDIMDASDVWEYNTGTKDEPYQAQGRLKTIFARTGALQQEVKELRAEVTSMSDDLKAIRSLLSNLQ